MCGVFGFATKNRKTPMYEWVTNLAIRTEKRGHHATGYAHFNGQGNITTRKRAIPAGEYVKLAEWTRLRNNFPTRFIGHCRYTSQGCQSNNDNNHPHTGKRYSLIHNGALKRYEYNPWVELCNTECDSEAILRVLELGDDTFKGIARVFNAFYDSAMACIVLDKRGRKMHFFRNCGRPLRVWRGDDFILVGSTEEIMEAAFVDTFKVSSNTVKGLQKWNPAPGTAYTIDKDLEIKKKVLFDFAKDAPEGLIKNTPDKSVVRNTVLPTKVQQYASGSYNFGSTGYGKPVRRQSIDSSGNIIYNFDSRED